MEALEKTSHDWFLLDEIYYRKFLMAKFPEPLKRINYGSCHIAVAKNGGLIAFVRKTKHFILDVHNPIKDSILIYYQNGVKEVDPIKFDPKETIILFEFTKEEDLICLLCDGRLYRFDIFCMKYDFDFIGLTFSGNNIIDAKLIGNSIMMLTENGDFYFNHNLNESSSLMYFSMKRYIPDFPYINYISSCGTLNLKNNLSTEIKNSEAYYPSEYAMIPPSNSSSGRHELLIPHPKHGLIIYVEGDNTVKYMKKNVQLPLSKQSGMDSFDSEDLGKIVKIMVSSNNSYVAFYNTDSRVYVFPTSLNSEEMSISLTGANLQQPFQMMWCSEDCIVASGQGNIYLIGPDDKSKILSSKTNCYIVQEIDGIRVIEDDHVDFIQRVSKELSDAIFPLSIDPSKKLIEVYKVNYSLYIYLIYNS
jgi:vacuolar protein sorting-associated protein 16